MPDVTRPSRELKPLPPRQSLPADPTTSRLIAGSRAAVAPPAPSSPPLPPPSTGLPSHLPPYLQLVRKESRLRQDQADELSREVRRLNQARRGSDGGTSGERITDNTLIRVAVDLLLARADELRGNTEAELWKSLTL